MGLYLAQGRLPRALATASAAALALALGSIGSAAAASDPPADAVKARQAKPETRYCLHRERVGTKIVEKLCKTRDRWVQEDGFDPIRHR